MEELELELEVDNLVSEIQVSGQRTLQRVSQIKSKSVEPADILFLETAEKNLQKYFINNPTYLRISEVLPNESHKRVKILMTERIDNLERLKATLEKIKKEHEDLNLTLDEYEKKSLEQYLGRVRKSMNMIWKVPAELDRRKGQRSLVERMQTIEPDKTAFESSMTLLIDLGIQISKFLSEYVMLAMPIFYDRNGISENLDNVETTLRCPSVEDNSIVINTFVSVVQSFKKRISNAAILYKGKGLKKRDFRLEHEIEWGLLHLILIEVLRLEVDFCYPQATMFNDVFFDPIHLKKNVYNDKMHGVSAKINELKKEMLSIPEEGSSMKGFLHQALDLAVQEEWFKVKSFLRKNKEEVTDWTMEKSKVEFEYLYKSLDEYEKKFKSCNVPKFFGEPLEQYLERLSEFMKLSWKEPVKKNREEKQRNLIEWMLQIDQSEVQNKITFDTLKTVIIDLGTQISMFLIEYFMLLMEISEKKEVLAVVDEVKTILSYLSVEENSVVINTFVSVVQSFQKTISLAGIIPDDAKGKGKMGEETSQKINFLLDNETKNSLLHLIITEVFRLEVCFCSPHMPMRVMYDKVLLAMETYLKDNVFKDKFCQINELKKEKLLIQDEGSSVKGLLHQSLDFGVEEEWNKVLEPKLQAGSW